VVLFNNHSDLKAYEKCQAANNGAYIGMGFPANIQPILDNSRIMMFVGADQPANREGLEWFLTQVWPIISNEVGDACLHIFGSIGKGLRHHQQPRVVIRGVVEDLSLGYAQAGLVISPLLSGTNGIKTKVAEAIAHGRPVVTTSVGVDAGDPGFFGEAVEVCDDATGFASAVVRLITDSELIRSRQLAARRTYHERLTPQTAYHAVDSLLSPHNTKSD
jgi:glycosyltransferase involved in cell wall biosynthesis